MDNKTCPFCQKEVRVNAFKCKHCGAWFTDDADARQKELDNEEKAERLVPRGKDDSDAALETETLCFSVPTRKLVTMSLLTGGFYDFYWFFRNWRAIKVQEQKKLSPFWRTFFAVFFCYTLFKRLLHAAGQKGFKGKYGPGVLAVIYIIFTVVSGKAPAPFDLIGILSFIPIIYVNEAVRFHNLALNPQYQERQPLAKGEILILLFGILVWTVTVLDWLTPATGIS